MGADVAISDGYIRVTMPEQTALHGADIRFDMVTVGATMNLMLAAALAHGVTVLRNAAREPHIVDLAGFINAMGGNVSGAGTDTVTIRGVSAMHGGEYSLIPDQIEAGTYMAATAAAGGSVKICDVIPSHLSCIASVLRAMNVEVTDGSDYVQVTSNGRLSGTDVVTEPYPGFPTDMQPQVGAVMCCAEGKSSIFESVWPDRFRYLEELKRMGAIFEVDGQQARITGTSELTGAVMTACDLRAGAAMIIAALAAKGESSIGNICLVERGYQDIARKLADLGADIREE
jgi:UDP-N-acetylglucosamine 1-carboxyvinyltransferase